MCGRFTLSTPPDALADYFELDAPVSVAPRYNIAPSQDVAVVRIDPDAGARALDLVRWGLVPSWSKEPPGSDARMINARAETLTERPAFRSAYKRRRCLLPADGFYEWKKTGGAKQPYLIRMRAGGLFAFAGLWERWTGAEGAPLDSCTILPTGPNELVGEIHNRMPVILQPKDFGLWLDPEVRGPERLTPLLVPFPSSEMIAFPVTRRVNNPRNDDPSCVEPMETDPGPPPDLFG
jgi:putative SOS response-associated peptidase YedK